VKALIFGGAGQVGRALKQHAPDKTQLQVMTRTTCDLTDLQAINSAIQNAKPDLVINAAAYTAVDKAEKEPEFAQAVNAVAPRQMAEAADKVGARLIHISTDFVFDGRLSRPYQPDDATAPLSVYGKTKRDGEMAVAAVGSNSLIVRTSWVYANEGVNFVQTMLRLMRERDEISVVADQVGTPTLNVSLAKAIWALAETDLTGICHFTDAGTASWYDFAVAITEDASAIGLLERSVVVNPITTDKYPTVAKRPSYSVLDKTIAWETLGAPSPHWRVNLRAALKELKNYV
jgi:dTDP-4-dehydrorhamnose reductase